MILHPARYQAAPLTCDCLDACDQSLIHDSRSGDTVCTSCAKVVEAFAFDERPEWFDDQAARAGPIHRLDAFLGITSSTSTFIPRYTKYQAPDPHKTLKLGLKEVERFAAFLRYDPDAQICLQAKQVYTDFATARKKKGCCIRENQRSLAAACSLYFGCKLVGGARTISEIAAVLSLPNEQCIDMSKMIRNELVDTPYHDAMCTAVQPRDMLFRALQVLEFKDSSLKRDILKLCHTLFEGIEQQHALEGRRPETVCAAVLYRACARNGMPEARSQILKACDITSATLKKALKDWPSE